ncbi:MAG: hypothetical protein JSV75_04330 [Candidatus Bathyarchaeota archaeon]|nr:MAG: hypothetical protein JSW72_01840 [Candidatus Bathyarchaeota archaeon]UCD26137.1 MAG: hypothetical protein JSV75_04330 [Candidatus Bathyarchaeota archaeon]
MKREWAEQLGSKCDIDSETLEHVIEELSESCYGDAKTARKVVEELTLKCSFKKGELTKFIREVSQNCPMDAKKLHNEILKAEGKREQAFQAIYRAARTRF